MSGYIGKGKSVVNVESYTKAQADARFSTAAQGALGASALQPDGDGSQLTGISGSATDIVALASDPSVGSAGKIYYNTTTGVLRTSDGAAWTNVSNAAPLTTGGTVALTSTNELTSFSYNLGTDFTDDRDVDTVLTYTLSSGTLPSGLSMPSAGSSTLAGTLGDVSADTAYAFAITATDDDGLTSAPQNYTMTILKVPMLATGGTKTTSGLYTVHTFTSSGTFQVTQGAGPVEYLVVAGGGGGSDTGGGGAGGYRSSVSGETSGANSSAENPINVTTTSYSVTVGGGGSGGANNGNGSNGSSSSFASVTSSGGGRGGLYNSNNAGSGGSGGGGQFSGGSGTSGQGKNGGSGYPQANASPYSGGGGGGASANGSNGSSGAGGSGGNGLYSSITGSSVARAGGGGGNTWTSSGSQGGTGGGGNGSRGSPRNQVSSNGTTNTGGGGGGGDGDTGGASYNPKSGGSGIVIIRYLT
jgi:hypothetical protein